MEKTGQDVQGYLAAVTPTRRRDDALVVLDIMREITGREAEMWSSGIVGFGTCHYRYPTGTEGLTGILGFAPRKASLTVYVFEGFDTHREALAQLGPHTTSVSCLYIKDLSKIDLDILRGILQHSYEWMLAGGSDYAALTIID